MESTPPQSDAHLYFEAGRGYSRFRFDQYLLPVDCKERQRLDIMHTMIQAARPKGRRLLDAPFVERRNKTTNEHPRVLDLGHGTGIWLMDMSETYRETAFYGLDMADMAPYDISPNVDLRCHVDYENTWALGESSFDLIHLQMGLGSIVDWPRLYTQVFRHLRSGAFFEHVEMDWTPRTSNGDMMREGKFVEWWHWCIAPPFDTAATRVTYNTETGSLFHNTGFEAIMHRAILIPTHRQSSPDDRATFVSGCWWEAAMGYGEDCGHGFEALSLALLTRFHGFQAEHVVQLCKDAIAQATDPAVEAYNVLHIWWAQKPAEVPS